jgi:hypothetical protein
MRLQGRVVPPSEVSREERDAMFALMDRHYENVCRSAFESDLDEKHWVIQLHDPTTGELCGFSTQMLLRLCCQGLPIAALFSGDTVIDRVHWGDQVLTHFWGRLALDLIDRHPDEELYWFLISKGYKTYRFLPVFFHHFDPHPDHPISPRHQAVLETLARSRYPRRYDPQAGVIRAAPDQDRLRPGIADLTSARLGDRFVRFFAARNPGHARGDELCCLAPLTRSNFTPAAYRVIGSPAGALA